MPVTTLNSMPGTHEKPLDMRCGVSLDTNSPDVKPEPLPDSKKESNIAMKISYQYKLEEKSWQNKHLHENATMRKPYSGSPKGVSSAELNENSPKSAEIARMMKTTNT